jgi:hypothetical protein
MIFGKIPELILASRTKDADKWLNTNYRSVVMDRDVVSEGGEARLVYDLWPEVGQMLGLTRNATYEAAKRGDIPTIRFGKLIKVPKLAFERMLTDAGAR